MKIIKVFVTVVYLSNTFFLKSSQPAQHSLIPRFQWSCHKKNANREELRADPDFVDLTTLLRILAGITQEHPAQNHWIFSSTNLPNFKRLKVQKTDLATRETQLATYTIDIPADNNSHLNTSIWGFHPYTTTEAHIGLTPYTATNLSKIFAQHDTPTSRALMPIVHCTTTATFTYAPLQPIRVDPLPRTELTIDNRYVDEFVMVDPANQTKQ